MRSMNVPHVLEPRGLHLDARLRPDGLTYVNWSRGKCMVWDVTVASSVSPTSIRRSAGKLGYAARISEQLKLQKYVDFEGRYLVQPIAFESHGCPGPLTEEFISECSRRLNEATGDMRSGTYFEQRLSLELQRGNVKAVLATMGGNQGGACCV